MGRRKRNNLNRKLNKVMLFLSTILIILIALAYIDAYILRRDKDFDNSNISDSLNKTSPSNDNEDLSEDNNASPDLSEASQPEDKPKKIDEPILEDIVDVEEPLPPEPIILLFAGDVNLDEDSKPVSRYDRESKGILGGISQELIDEMNQADIFMLNNEFAFSKRGKEIKEKSYTFRADPKRVDILKEMGVDIVSLANNHALDFREEALLDTFITLEEANIEYVGAGINLERAKAPVYYTIVETKIAYVAASHVIYAMDWYATDTRPGMIGTYDPTLFLASIREAKENSDFVVAYVHWGKERVHEPVDYQKNLAKKYIDAGADVVIGCHPHVMQGIEIYKGKTIAYSLGNYWFNAAKRESGLIKIYINPDGTTDTQLLPAMNDNTYTYLISEEAARNEYYKFMEDISFDVKFDEKGYVSQK